MFSWLKKNKNFNIFSQGIPYINCSCGDDEYEDEDDDNADEIVELFFICYCK